MRNRILLPLIIFFVFSIVKVSAQSQKSGTKYTLSWIDRVVRDKENGNDTENYMGVFSN